MSSYLGNIPSNNFVSLKRQVITGNGGASYTLDYSVASVNDVAIFVSNVRQNPSSYSISGTSLTLGGNIDSNTECYVLFLGQGLQTVTPASGTITSSMLASGDLTIPSGNLLFDTASKGIYLGVTSATASNLLDDYEEGTWTPVLTAQTGSISSYSAEGKYTKIGDLVYLWMYWNISNVGSATDNCFISGYPFTAKATTTNNVHYVGVGKNSSNNTGSITITEETTSGLINLYNGGISSNIMATGMNWRFTLVYLAD